jgi:nucleoside phosphorylase
LSVLLIWPIPLEFTGCRSAFALRDGRDVAGCRTARGTAGSIEPGNDSGLSVRPGMQASGELFSQSTQVRESLFSVSGALACNRETAGVFIGALRSRVPPLCLRIVSDFCDEDALRDFRRNSRKASPSLYRFLRAVFESGWIASFLELWSLVPRGQREKLPQRVLP